MFAIRKMRSSYQVLRCKNPLARVRNCLQNVSACRFGRIRAAPTSRCVPLLLRALQRATVLLAVAVTEALSSKNRPVPVPCTQVVRSVDRDVRALFMGSASAALDR